MVVGYAVCTVKCYDMRVIGTSNHNIMKMFVRFITLFFVRFVYAL